METNNKTVLIGMTRSDTVASGSLVHIRMMSEHLKGLGYHAIVVLGGEENEKIRQEFSGKGVEVVFLPVLANSFNVVNDVRSLLFLVGLILKRRVFVCSWHTSKIGAIGRVASFVTSRKALYTPHGVAFSNVAENKHHKFYKLVEKMLLVLPGKIICVSESDYKEFVRIGAGASRLVQINNGMPDIEYERPLREERSDKRLCVATAARFEPQKDYRTLVEALKLLDERGVEFRLDIFGEGSQRAEIEECVKGLENIEVNFRGVVSDLRAEIVNFDVFILVSNWEGLPRSIIEAMSCSCAVIATDVGGCSELVVDGDTGYLVPKGDAEEIASRLEAYFEYPEYIEKHGKSGRDRFLKEFTIDRVFREFVAQVQEV